MAEYRKTFVNSTDYPAAVTALVRLHDDLSIVADRLEFTITAGSTHVAEIPNEGSMPFLNAVTVMLGDRISVQAVVRAKDDRDDQLINRHDTLTITMQGGEARITGSNSARTR